MLTVNEAANAIDASIYSYTEGDEDEVVHYSVDKKKHPQRKQYSTKSRSRKNDN